MIIRRTNVEKWKAAFTQLTDEDPTIRGADLTRSPTNRLALFKALCQIAEAVITCKVVNVLIILVIKLGIT
jgi:hypothetical protein